MDNLGLNARYDELVRKYGEDNARHIWEMTTGWQRNYRRLAYLELGLGGHLGYDEEARREAEDQGWEFAKLPGDLGLLRRLLDGDWGIEDFVVLSPGEKLVATHDDEICASDAVVSSESDAPSEEVE
jgi:hypothetical protein